MSGTISSHPEPTVLYADLREKWKHEDDLVNQRMTWLLNTQLFMLSGYGILARWQLGDRPPRGEWLVSLSAPIMMAVFLVPLLALFVIFVLGRGIWAAFAAMDRLKADLHEHQRLGRLWSGIRVDVLETLSNQGAGGPKGLVYAFATAWVLLLCLELAGLLGL